MDDAYYRAPVGSAAHREAYAKEFEATDGIGAADPSDAEFSYYVDNAWELDYERYMEDLAEEHYASLEANPPEFQIADDEPQADSSEPEIEMEPW